MPDYLKWLRSKIGRRKVILPYATALVRDDQGRLLFQRRSDFDWWGLPGGVLEIGENFEQCAVRETLEETGFHVQPVRLSGLYTSPDYDVQYPNGDEVQQCTVAIECQVVSGAGLPDGVETFEHRFFSEGEAAALHLPRWYADMVCHCFESAALPARAGAVEERFQKPYFDPPFSPPAADGNWWRAVRQLTGPDRLITVGAGAIIRNERGQILLTLRREGLWGIPAGLMDLGESAAGTLVREAKEELNAEVAVRELLGVFTGPESFHIYPDGNQVQIVSVLFRADLLSHDLKPDGDETLALGWFDVERLPDMVLRHRRMVEYAVGENQGKESSIALYSCRMR